MRGSVAAWRARLVWYGAIRFWPVGIVGAYLLLLCAAAFGHGAAARGGAACETGRWSVSSEAAECDP